MAKKIFKGVGGLLGIGKKKKAPVEEPKGPIITALNPEPEKFRKGFRGRMDLGKQGTILGGIGGVDKLGG